MDWPGRAGGVVGTTLSHITQWKVPMFQVNASWLVHTLGGTRSEEE